MSAFNESGNLMVEDRGLDAGDAGDAEVGGAGDVEAAVTGGDGPTARKRGTKPGTRRGPYNRVSIQARAQFHKTA